MKVNIRKYSNFFGPYQFMDWLFWPFSRRGQFGQREYPEWHEKLSDWYAESWLGSIHEDLANWYFTWRDRNFMVKVHIDPWDTWSMDHTLAPIILPMLRQLRDTKHGSAIVDDADVPHLPRQQWTQNENPQLDLFASDELDEEIWAQYEVRWNWVLDEMIWAFEQKVNNDWEQQYYTVEHDAAEPLGMRFTNYDLDAIRRHQERMSNGFRLFGKYYEALWD